MSEHESHGERPDVQEEWERLAVERKKFITKEAFEYISKEAFVHDKDCVCCIDERVASRDTLGGNEVNGRWFIAGSGILLPVESWRDRAKIAAEEAFKRGIKQFSYHAGCGAAKLAVDNDLSQLEEPDKYLLDPNLHAEQFSSLAQAELNKLNKINEKVIFVPKKEVVPFGFHNAIGAVVDGTGEFNPHVMKDGEPLKHCFMLDWKSGSELTDGKQNAGYNLIELQTAIGIAFDHGFGDKFDSKNRFNVVLISHDSDQLKEMKNAVKAYISYNLGKQKDFIEIIPYLR